MLKLNDSISLDEVAGFNKTQVDGFFTKIGGLFDPSIHAVQLKEKILALESMRLKFEKIGNPNDTTSIDQYINTAVAFKQANISYTFFTTIPDFIDYLLPPLKRLADPSSHASLNEDSFNTILSNLKHVEKIPVEIQSMLDKFSTHEFLFKPDILKSDFVRKINLIEEYVGIVRKVDEIIWDSVEHFNEGLTAVNGLKTEFDAVKSSLDIAVQVGNSLSSKKVSHGFINGFADVIKLRYDVQDTWLSTSIANYDSALMKTELKPFKQFEAGVTDLDLKWKKLVDWRTIKKMSKVLETFGASADTTLLKKVAMAMKFGGSTNYSTPIIQLVNNVLELHQSLSNIRFNLTMILKTDGMQYVKNLTYFKKDIDFSNGQTVSEVISKMPPPEELKKLITLLGNIHPTLHGIRSVLLFNNPNSLAGEIESKKAEVTKFMNDPDRLQHLAYFGNVSGLSLEKLVEPVSLLETSWEIKTDAATFTPALESITGNLSDSLQILKYLRAVPDVIAFMSTPGIDKLIEMKGLESHMETIGKAVMVLDKAQTLMSNRSAIEKFLINGWRVNITEQVPQDEKQLAEDWRGFGELAAYFVDLFEKLDNKTASMRSASRLRRQPSTLVELANKMILLKDLPDLDVDLKPIMHFLKTFPTIPNSLEMLKTLEAVDRLDLRFSSYNSALDNVGAAFSSAVALFSLAQAVSAAPETSSVAPIAPRDPVNKSPENLKIVLENDSKESGGIWMALIIISFVICLVLLALSISAIYYLLNRMKKMDGRTSVASENRKTPTASVIKEKVSVSSTPTARDKDDVNFDGGHKKDPKFVKQQNERS